MILSPKAIEVACERTILYGFVSICFWGCVFVRGGCCYRTVPTDEGSNEIFLLEWSALVVVGLLLFTQPLRSVLVGVVLLLRVQNRLGLTLLFFSSRA